MQPQKWHEMNRELPSYLLKISTNVKILAFVALFSIVFVCVYNPIAIFQFIPQDISQPKEFLYSSIIIIAATLLLLVSRCLMCLMFRKKGFTLFSYIIWLVAEVVFLALSYSAFAIFVAKDSRSFYEILRGSFIFIPSMLILPYAFSYLYFALKIKNIKINDLLSSMKKESTFSIEEPLSFYANDTTINLRDAKDELKLSIRQENLLYAEAASNYTIVYYLKNDKIERLLLRSTFKKVEEQLTPHGFARCHRGYIVNLRKVQLVRKESDGFFLDMEHNVNGIPISQTYAGDMIMRFTSGEN